MGFTSMKRIFLYIYRAIRPATSHHRLHLFWIFAIVGLAAPWGCAWIGDFRLFTSTSTCTVNSIYDGDTMRLTCGGEKVKVRLYCIDAPEMKQKPWGKESRDYLRAITPETVDLIRKDKDRYGRIVGEVIAGDPDGNDRESLNLAQVAFEHAAVYPNYCKDERFYQAQRAAKGTSDGIWEKPGEHQAPWRFRH